MSTETVYGVDAARRVVGVLLKQGLIEHGKATAALEAIRSIRPRAYGPREMITCIDCGANVRGHHARPERCSPCHHRESARNRRRGEYHTAIKNDPAKLEAHRKQSREAVERCRARKRGEDVPYKPRFKLETAPNGREVSFDGDRVYVRRMSRPLEGEPQAPMWQGHDGDGLQRELQAGVAYLHQKGPAAVVEARTDADAPRPAPRARSVPAEPRAAGGDSRPTDGDSLLGVGRSRLESCGFCFKKFRGEGLYCSPEHEAKAQVPGGHDGSNFSRSYRAK